jgi:hypothetical protein
MDKPLPKSTLRVVQAEVQRLVGRDFNIITDLLKHIESQNKVIVMNHNAALREQQKHNEAVARTLAALSDLLSVPEHHSVVVATIKEFLNHIK